MGENDQQDDNPNAPQRSSEEPPQVSDSAADDQVRAYNDAPSNMQTVFNIQPSQAVDLLQFAQGLQRIRYLSQSHGTGAASEQGEDEPDADSARGSYAQTVSLSSNGGTPLATTPVAAMILQLLNAGVGVAQPSLASPSGVQPATQLPLGLFPIAAVQLSRGSAPSLPQPTLPPIPQPATFLHPLAIQAALLGAVQQQQQQSWNGAMTAASLPSQGSTVPLGSVDRSAATNPNPPVGLVDVSTTSTRKRESFPTRLYRMLLEIEAQGKDDIISFTGEGNAVQIHRPDAFVEILPDYFRHRNVASFKRQLSMYVYIIGHGSLAALERMQSHSCW